MDPTAARCLFPLTKQFIFMNNAGVAPMSDRARAAIENLMEQLVTRPYQDGTAQEDADRLRQSIGRLIGADPNAIALVRGTAHGVSLLAQGLAWQPGDNVVGARGQYPANVDPWMALADRGVELRLAQPVEGRVTAESVLSLVDERTRVVALTHVEFWNGYRSDILRLGDELRSRGVVFCLDATQSAGALHLDMASQPVDFLTAGAHKWLLGPKGIGFCYCRKELLPKLRPVLVGSGALTKAQEYFEYDYQPRDSARWFEESSLSVLDMAAFSAAVELLLEVGPRQVEAQVLGLAGRLARGLAERGYQLVEPWPRELHESSGIVSFRRPGSSPQEVLRELNAARVVARAHADFVRLSPHFYNNVEEVNRVLALLAPGGESAA
jgi:cysteine desulfurase / selenocysteine lyase